MLERRPRTENWTLSISITQRSPCHNHKSHGTGLLLGTDFRHAVEFSRSGRAETRPFRASILAGSPTLRRFPTPPSPGGWPGGPLGPRGAWRTIHDFWGVVHGPPVEAPLRLGERWSEAQKTFDPDGQTGAPADLADG